MEQDEGSTEKKMGGKKVRMKHNRRFWFDSSEQLAVKVEAPCASAALT